jgi:Holliday junction resolvasome RuvABC endonuclease subunit
MTNRTVTKILGVDPGICVTGHATLIDFVARRALESTGILSVDKNWSIDKRIDAQTSAFEALLEQKAPHVVAIESYVYQGERSHGQNAFWLSRLIGRFEQAARMAKALLITVDKQEANRALGMTGKVSEARVRAAIAAVFPPRKVSGESDEAYTIAAKNRPRTPHEDDAVLVALAGAQRWRMVERVSRAQ